MQFQISLLTGSTS
uniref:Uncharacterized protein n=1 Tax=Arundo donax TaxID=35708 RepID=A0A0A9HWY7_ARUDO